MWQPVRTAFNNKDSSAVLRHTFKYFAGDDLVDKLPVEVISQLKQSLGEWHALAFSPNGFAQVKMESLKKIDVPVLIITAGQTIPVLEPLNKKLINLLPKAKHFHLAIGTHNFWMENPDVIGKQLLAFIEEARIK